MPENQLPHLQVNDFAQSRDYRYPFEPRIKFQIAERNRRIHGATIRQKAIAIRNQFDLNAQQELPVDIVRDDVVYTEFVSATNLPFKFDSLNSDASDPNFQILNIKEEHIDERNKRYRIVVMMRQGGISKFISKVNKYINENVKRKGVDTGRPMNEPLINNIEDIQLASLQSFWTDEPEIPFPQPDSITWWEVWFRRTLHDDERINRVTQNLEAIGAEIAAPTLQFPEHRVKLVRASARQLSSSLFLLDNLAELRKPQELNDFVMGRNVLFETQNEWMEDLRQRTDIEIGDNSVLICLLDSGVNNQHPLLERLLPNNRTYAYKESWGRGDSVENGGHGTPMAGLAAYGNLTEALATPNRIRILHGLESFKIFFEPDPSAPEFYGAVTEYAVSTPVVDSPNNPRVYCLSITDPSLAFKGRPSSWSAALDKITFGNLFDPQAQQLMIVSGGNVDYVLNGRVEDYFTKNHYESVHDPGQSYNALTIGTYTRMDRIDQAIWPNIRPLAPNGGMSPSNSTSVFWESQWPNKPDLVFEGGNLGVLGEQIRDDIHSLKPLSTDKEFQRFLFYPFGDTSGAAALASKMAAELKTIYPGYWPETIRGLMVHSADWTATMLNGLDLAQATQAQKRTLLRSFGYGVPSIEKAEYSANNILTMISEQTIRPYIQENGSVAYNEYHLYSLPWPEEVLLEQLTDTDVKLVLTLSYFIEPNPGERRYANNFQYHSHSLDFKVIKPTEDRDTFLRRISKPSENEEDVGYQGQSEPWTLKDSLRGKGSIKKDFIISSGADLSRRNLIAIYPKNGWYKTRKKLGKSNAVVRYSMIMSIESEDVNVDIYNPVFNMVRNYVRN